MHRPSQIFPFPPITRRTALKASGRGFLGLLGMSHLATMLSSAAPGPTDAKNTIAPVVKGNSEFAFDLYAKLRDNPGNLFFSPESISTALAMTYAGARGETAEEMAKTLHFALKEDQLHSAFHTLIGALNGAGKKRGYQLSIANALWGQKGFGFRPEFLKLTQDHYGAELQQVDFAGDSEGARKTINAWVEKQTKDKVKDLFQSGALDSTMRLVLTNAIYFKGDWDRQFKKDATRKEAFHVSADQKTDAMMMHDTRHFKYLDGGYRILHFIRESHCFLTKRTQGGRAITRRHQGSIGAANRG